MKLYEIDEAIMSCIDQETGEVIDIERLNALEMEREKKIEGVILWMKSLKAEAEAIKAEADVLLKRYKVLMNKVTSLKDWIVLALAGEKFKTARCSVTYRRASSVKIDDIAKIPAKFLKEIKEDWIAKTEIKKAIEAGEEVEGAHIEESQSAIMK